MQSTSGEREQLQPPRQQGPVERAWTVHQPEDDYILLVIGHAEVLASEVAVGTDHLQVKLSKLAVKHLESVTAQCSTQVRSWTQVDHLHRLFRFSRWLHCLAESALELVQRQAHQRSI